MMSGYLQPHKNFLSPLDALEIHKHHNNIRNHNDGDASSIHSDTPRSPSFPSTTTTTTSSPVSPSSDFWSVDYLDQQFPGGALQAQIKKPRRYSEQDLITRQARASLPSKHRSTASYPFYTPTAYPSVASYAPKPPFLPWGVAMEPPRLYGRPTSSASSRSSFESRLKSPLSISSSVDGDFESARTSFDSSYSNASRKSEYSMARPAVPPLALGTNKPTLVQPSVPAYARYGAGGQGRQQTQRTLMTPQRIARGPPSPTYTAPYKPRIPGEGFRKLPEEILLVILGELKKSHLDVGSLSCSTCWMRDLINLGASCKKWWSAARFMLYEDIQLSGCDSVIHTKKKYKLKYGTRLTLLRRTLRLRPDVAEYVKSLKVPSMPDAAKTKKDQDEYLDLVASIIMTCPNLERLPGFYPAYNHTFSRLVHALSTRTKLKEAVWIINPSPFQRQRRYNVTDDEQFMTPIFAPGFLLPDQCIEFLTYHSNWEHLKTMFLHCNPGGTIDSLLFADICNRLPSIENLHVSAFPPPAFNDTTLTSLPALKSLRLDNLPGITANGLSAYACLESSKNLKSLSLISLPLLSLPVLSRLFSHLRVLTHFTLSQAPSPGLPIGTDIFLHPYLASHSLEYLHWEITNPDDDKATSILSKSIFYSGFPSLRTLRAPTDFDGTLQKLCKPRERIELPGDRYRNMGHHAAGQHPGMPGVQNPNLPSPTRSTFSMGHGRGNSVSSTFVKSPTRSTFSLNMDQSRADENEYETREKGMSLVAARRTAQQHIDAATSQPKFHIIVWDSEGQFVERHTAGGFVGMVQSKVFYSLRPDVDGMDEAVVTVDGLGGLLDGGEETCVRDGCTGSWNLHLASQGRSGKSGSGKEKWWHTERGRWREVPLEKFF